MNFQLSAAAWLLAGLVVQGQDPAPRGELAPEKDAYAWFDKLGFPDVKGRPFVKVATGAARFANGEVEKHYLRGFLLEETQGKQTVLTEDLAIRTFQRTGPDADEQEKVDLEVLDLQSAALEFAERALKDPDKVLDRFARHGPNLELPAKLFVFARACERQAAFQAAHKVYEAASELLENRRNYFSTGDSRRARPKADKREADRRGDNGKPRTLREAAAVQIGHVVFWRAILDFQDPQKTRKDLLETLRPFADRFPESEHAETALELVPVLERMVREDETKISPPADLKNLPKNEQAGTLVYLLRDQGCQVFSRPGGCSIFSGWGFRGLEGDSESLNPASELAQMGYDAFPILIEALEDDTLTRAVSSFRDHFFSHRVMTVGDCAHEILEHVAGWQFYRRLQANPEDYRADRTVAKKAIVAWWAAFQEKGEKQILIEGTEAGDATSHYQARMLVQKYPDAAPAAIQRGMERAKNDRNRNDLLRILSEVGGEAAQKQLRKEIREGGTLKSRVSAAEGLLTTDREKAVSALMTEWKNLCDNKLLAEGPAGLNDESAQEDLLKLLATSDSPAAIQTLRQGLDSVPLNFRRRLIDDLDHALSGFLTKAARDSRVTIEALLLSRLDDKEETQVMGSNGHLHPRICDLAAECLSENWKEKYAFASTASLRHKDQAIDEIKARKDLPPDSSPPRSGEVDPDVPNSREVEQLLDSVALDGTGKVEATLRLEALGPAALRLLHKKLTTLPDEDAARGRLSSLARRLECIVLDVDFYPETPPGFEKLETLLKSFQRKPIAVNEVSKLLREFALSPLPGATGLEVLINRAREDSGLALTLRLASAPQRPQQRGFRDAGWRTELSYAGIRGAGGGGHGSIDPANADSFQKLEEDLQEKLEESSGQPMVVKIRLLKPQTGL